MLFRSRQGTQSCLVKWNPPVVKTSARKRGLRASRTRRSALKPTAKLSGFVTLGVTLCASWTQAASTTVAPTTMIGPTMVGQAPARSATRTQSDDLLRRARQAIREGKYDLANKLISQAEELKVTYDPVFSRFSDTPAKLRKELEDRKSTRLNSSHT